MGNTPISTSETEIYYPSDWMIEGGPTFGSMGCPTILRDPSDFLSISLVNIELETRWRIVITSPIDPGEMVVLAESTNKKDIVKYFMDYMESFDKWLLDSKEREEMGATNDE